MTVVALLALIALCAVSCLVGRVTAQPQPHDYENNRFAVLLDDPAVPFFKVHPKNSFNRVLLDLYASIRVVAIREVGYLTECGPYNPTCPSETVYVVKSLSNVQWTAEHNTFEIVPGLPVNSFKFTTQLDNGANFILTGHLFKDQGASVPIALEGEADYMYPVEPNTGKLTYKFENWPFLDENNWISLEMEFLFSNFLSGYWQGAISPELHRVSLSTSFFETNITLLGFAVSDGYRSPIYYDASNFGLFGGSYHFFYTSSENFTEYDPDFSVLLVNEPTCPNDCFLQGTCVSEGQCSCDPGWAGSQCETAVCPGTPQCNDRGSCSTAFTPPVCNCITGWTGLACEIPDCPGSPDCSSHGSCNTASFPPTCSCFPGWSTEDCSQAQCPDDCSGKGECNELVDPPQCNCNSGWVGASCSQEFNNCTSDTQCNQGVCNALLHYCDCNEGWIGQDCSTATCPGYNEELQLGNCLFHGDCMIATFPPSCSCHSGWMGEDCSSALCAGQNCSGNGVCITEGTPTCSCSIGSYGVDCSQEDATGSSFSVTGMVIGVSFAVVVVVVGVAGFGLFAHDRRSKNLPIFKKHSWKKQLQQSHSSQPLQS